MKVRSYIAIQFKVTKNHLVAVKICLIEIYSDVFAEEALEKVLKDPFEGD